MFCVVLFCSEFVVLGNLSVGTLWILVEAASLQKGICLFSSHLWDLNSWLEGFFLSFSCRLFLLSLNWSTNLCEGWLMVINSWSNFFHFSYCHFLCWPLLHGRLASFLTFPERYRSLGLSFKWRTPARWCPSQPSRWNPKVPTLWWMASGQKMALVRLNF